MLISSYVFSFVAGGKVSEIDPDYVGVNPAWRKAVPPLLVSRGPRGHCLMSHEIEEMVSGVK